MAADVQVQLEPALNRRARRAAAAAAAEQSAVAAAARAHVAVKQQAACRRLAELQVEATQARMQYAVALAGKAGAEAEAAAADSCLRALFAELDGERGIFGGLELTRNS